jgi:ATP-dependent DNA helicase RecQ
MDVAIEPRKRWPAGVGRKGSIDGFVAGRAVAFADDPGWVAELQTWQQSPPGHVPDELLAGAVATLARWSTSWPNRPVCVVPLPATNMADNRQLAAYIAQRGKLALHDVFTWTGGPAPDDSASTPAVLHLQSVIGLSEHADLPAGTVLLVASTVRTRWAATVAGALLRDHGVSQVLLLTLHLQP